MWQRLYCAHGVVFQTDGWTPLHIASQNGHVECVRALLDRGAAINQATVGCTIWMAEYCSGLCVCGDVREAPCMRVQLVWRAGMKRG